MKSIPIIDNFVNYSEKYLKIVAKDGQLIPFMLNPFQLKTEACYQYQKDRGIPIRIIELKARQVGGSTYGTGKAYWRATTMPFHSAFIMAHDSESTDNLFRMVKTYHEFMDHSIRPETKYSNKTLLDFRNPEENAESKGLMSSIRVGTAGNKRLGRSKTNQTAHLSEGAFWENAGVLITSVCQTVPSKPDTLIFKESTANGIEGGIGEQFYIDWLAAVRGESDYLPVFCPWWELPDYEMPVINDFTPGDRQEKYGDEKAVYAFLKNDKPYTVGLIDSAKGFEHEQILRKLQWRRFKIDNDMGRDVLDPLDQFAQEYPMDWEEAFISSGRPVFPNKELKRHILELEMHPPKKEKPDFLPERIRGNMTVFEKPQPDVLYSLGVDVSEGLADGDFSDIRVLNEHYEEVAFWHGKVDEDTLGEYVAEIAKAYNGALYAIEVNNMGISTQKAAQKVFHNTFMRRIVDKITEEITLRPGWRTDIKTKNIMIIDLKAFYRDGAIKIKDKELLREMMSCQREPDGSVKISGKDRVAAMCVAIQACKEIPRIERPVVFPHQTVTDPVSQFKTRDEYLKHLDRQTKRGDDSYYD